MKISVIGGAGKLGGCIAFALASQKMADEIVIVDINRNLLLGQVMDMSLAMTGQYVNVRDGEYKDISNSDMVIITATTYPHPSGSLTEDLRRNIETIRQSAEEISQFCPEAIVIMVTNPIDSLCYAMYLSSTLDRKKIIGYNLNDSLRFRMATAKALGIKSIAIEGLAIGEHVGILAFLFSSIRIDGKPVSLSEDNKQQIRKEAPNILRAHSSLQTGLPLVWTSTVGVLEMIRLIHSDAKQMTSCSAVLDGEYGYNGFSMGVPVILGHEGIDQVIEMKLPADELDELGQAATSLKKTAEIVNQIIGPKHQ
jgi:malate dehydrogenase